MSVFKNLKSIFIVEEEATENKADETAKTESKKPSENKAAKSDPVKSDKMTDSPGKRDEKIINTLFKAIEKSNLNGFDYIEFKQAVKGLEKMVTDEATRFKSAFATASTMGVTMDKLVETADYYGKVLDKEKEQFLTAASEQAKHMVEDRKRELQLMLKAMGEKKKMIEQLQEELKNSEAKIQTIQDSINNASVKINNTKKNFEVSYGFLRKQIVNDIEKIKTYLK